MQEIGQAGKVLVAVLQGFWRGEGGVGGGGQDDGVPCCEGEKKGWGEGAFEMEVEFHLGKAGKEGMERRATHGDNRQVRRVLSRCRSGICAPSMRESEILIVKLSRCYRRVKNTGKIDQTNRTQGRKVLINTRIMRQK